MVQIRNPKVKNTKVQHVLIEDHFIARFGNALKAASQDWSARIFPFDEFSLLKAFTLLVQILCIPEFVAAAAQGLAFGKRLTPGGLRSGGATHDYLLFQNLDRLQWRGRWATRSVLEHYIQLGVFASQSNRWNTRTQQQVQRSGAFAEAFLVAL